MITNVAPAVIVGVMVTTSYVHEQAYREVTDDGHCVAWVAHRAEPLPVSRRLVAEVKRRLLQES